MCYLILASTALAQTRSEQAAAEVPGLPGPGGTSIWSVRPHPSDGRAALMIPETPEGAGLGISQEDYDAMLTGGETAALLTELPGDWISPED